MSDRTVSHCALALPCIQGGFQSSWTGRNGGGGPSNLLQDVRQVAGGGIARTQQGARRRFGTVSNPSVVRGLSTYPEKKVVSPGQHEPVLGPGQNSPEGVSSQVRPVPLSLHIVCTILFPRPFGRVEPPDTSFYRTKCLTMYHPVLLYARTFCDRFASATGLSQLHPRGYFQVHDVRLLCVLEGVERHWPEVWNVEAWHCPGSKQLWIHFLFE